MSVFRRWGFVVLRISGLLGLLLFTHFTFAYAKRPFLIAVAGGSASGKTFYARQIAEALGADRAVLVSADNYYAPEKQPFADYLNGRVNYDHPSAVDLQKLAWHLAYLRSGFPVQVAEYGFGQTVEVPKLLQLEPKEFIVVEGIFALQHEIADLVDYRVFVDVSSAVRYQRRLERDRRERGLSEQEVRAYFEAVVEPMHARYVQPTALRADHIIESPDNPAEVERIVSVVKELTQKSRKVKSGILQAEYESSVATLMRKYPGRYRLMNIDELFPSQPELGFLALSLKSAEVDDLVRASALRVEQASRLTEYLEANPVPVVYDEGRAVVIDHHHLMTALLKKGIRSFLTVEENNERVDRLRLEWARGSGRHVRFEDLRNNPYRSLASLVRNLGFVKKTGKPHEEFEWATYFELRLKQVHGIELREEQLLDVDHRREVLNLAISLARAPEAKMLPGYQGDASSLCGQLLK